jgi:hypothetical protein
MNMRLLPPLLPLLVLTGVAPKLPGRECAASGSGHTFFGQSWANTCECVGASSSPGHPFPPQKPGDQCNWWTQPCTYCCASCDTANRSNFECLALDNVMQLPMLYDRWFGWTTAALSFKLTFSTHHSAIAFCRHD